MQFQRARFEYKIQVLRPKLFVASEMRLMNLLGKLNCSMRPPGTDQIARLRLEISWGPLRVKPAIQAHLGVENPGKHTFGQNCPNTTQLLRF